jgi:hypothetical protein
MRIHPAQMPVSRPRSTSGRIIKMYLGIFFIILFNNMSSRPKDSCGELDSGFSPSLVL